MPAPAPGTQSARKWMRRQSQRRKQFGYRRGISLMISSFFPRSDRKGVVMYAGACARHTAGAKMDATPIAKTKAVRLQARYFTYDLQFLSPLRSEGGSDVCRRLRPAHSRRENGCDANRKDESSSVTGAVFHL